MWPNRIAVSTFFFINGFLYANWAARLPEFQRYLDISDATLGTLLLLVALGSLVAMPMAGWLNNYLSSQRMTSITGILFCLLITGIAFSPKLTFISPLFFVLGMITGSLDVSMNGQAVFVERAWSKPIMSSFHALFSIGMALGAGAGALFAKFEVSLTMHFQIGGLFGLICVFIASFFLFPEKKDKEKKVSNGFQLPTKAILPIGLIAFCGMLGEGAMVDWSAIFMNKVVGKDEAFSAIALGVFTVAMTAGRMTGDYMTLRIGKKKLLIGDTILAIVGLALVLIFATAWVSLLGFAMVGLGLSTIVPIIYSTAGNTPGVTPSVGIAMASTIGYAGFFFGPPIIGYLSDNFGLRIGLSMVLILFVVMGLLINRFVRFK